MEDESPSGADDLLPPHRPPPPDEAALEPAVVTPRSYEHITKALHERPWAIQPQMLRFMAELVRFRSDGGLLSAEDIDQRLAAARADNGERMGGAQVGAVAVIPMYGVISQRTSLMSSMSGGTSIDELRNALRTALNDPTVKAVVFDIDSPGGAIDGVPEFAAELRSVRRGSKPIVAQFNTLGASAAYWIASQMSELVVTPSGEVGSIGVFAMHEDVSGAAERAGVKTTLISAGEFKTEGNQFEPLSDEARAAIQGQVNDFYQMFVSDVAKGRGVAIDTVSASYGGGRTLLAKQALAAGMVDRIDTIEATVARLQPNRVSTGRAAVALPPELAAIAASIPPRADPAWNGRMAARMTKRSLW